MPRETAETPLPGRAQEIDRTALADAIRGLFGDRMATERLTLHRIACFDTLRREYARNDYAPRWISNGLITPAVNALLRYFRGAASHGIEPSRYHYPKLESLIKKHLGAGGPLSGESYRDLAAIDLMLSDGLIRYARDMRYGVLNPKELNPDEFFLPVRRPNYDELLEPFAAEDIDRYLASIQPAEPRYRLLQSALAYYDQLARRTVWTPIPQVTTKLRRGDVSPVVPLIAERLRALVQSSIVADGMSARLPCTPFFFPALFAASFIDRDSTAKGIYDTTLALAVRQYQRDHGLQEDGVIGKGTIDNLNVTPEDRIRQIDVNLDRMRWFRLPKTGPFARVNIPEFCLYAFEEGIQKVKMKVCVGERFRGWSIHGHSPMNYQTPELYGTLTYLVLNPLWNVPHSIAIRETYYQALKDPAYLLRNNYRVYVKDSLVNPVSIQWAKVNPEKIPYRFVQGAGRGNALGRIKFMFYNDFDVYLHDTPKRLPFRNASRAVSHGCVRIEEPMSFVKFLLEGHSTWTPAKIQAYLNQTQEGKIVFLERKVPIYLDYVTAWVDEAGRIQLRDDVYGKDRVLEQAFARAMER